MLDHGSVHTSMHARGCYNRTSAWSSDMSPVVGAAQAAATVEAAVALMARTEVNGAAMGHRPLPHLRHQLLPLPLPLDQIRSRRYSP